MSKEDRSRRRAATRQVPDVFEVPDVPVPYSAEATAEAPAAHNPVTGVAGDGLVEVEVDPHGQLLNMRIDRRLLRGAHPHRVGQAVVEAMADARGHALRLARERLDQAREGES